MPRSLATLIALSLLVLGASASAQQPPVFGGLGMVVGMRDAYPTVIRVLPGTPAERAGLRAEDRIVRIDGHRTRGGYLPNLVQRMRGQPGTAVTLWVARPKRRGAVSRPRRVRVVRALIRAHPPRGPRP